MKKILFAIVFISPPFLKKLLLKWFCRARFGRKSSIGWFSSVVGSRIALGDYSKIKPLTLVRCDGEVIVGNYSEISSFSVIYGCASLRLGDRCYIGPQTWINVSEDIITGNGVGIGPRSMIFTHGSFLPYTEGYPVRFGKVIIGDNVWIPAGVFVQPGIEIGDNVLINSRSVLTKSLPSDQYVAGFPAKPIRPMSEVRKQVEPGDRDKLILDTLEHFFTFLLRANKGIGVIKSDKAGTTLRSHGRTWIVVLVDSNGKLSLDLNEVPHDRVMFLVNSADWTPPQVSGRKQHVFDFTTMKTQYSLEKIHNEFYNFLKMYYGIIFEYQ